ncbi:MAG TPA: PAS domain S-box protein [Vicinamibacterales bacterium]|jgi:PAS domain S-box-containing protein
MKPQPRGGASLRESEERLKFALEGANDGIWDVDMGTNAVVLSPRGCRMFGYEPAEFSADVTAWNAMVHPDDLPPTNAALDAHLAGQAPFFQVEQRLRAKSGEYLWVLTRGKVSARDATGRPTRMTGTHTDITARKQAEDALRASEMRYRTLFENMVEGFAYCRMLFEDGRPQDFVYLAVNDAFETLTGLKGVAGKRVSDVIPGIRETDPALFERYARVASTGQPERFEFYLAALDMWLDLSVYSPEREHFVAVFDVITERKLAEAERERLMAAIEQSGEIIFITDPDGTIRYVNPTFEAVTGYTRQEALGRTPSILKSGQHDAAWYRELWATISGGRTWKGRIVNRRKDGTLYTEEATISPVCDPTGRIINFVAVERDMTAHLRLEEQLRASQKMEAIGSLAGGVAHDFNNLLTVILGCTAFAIETLREGDPLREDLLEVQKAGERAAVLTRQLLAFSRKQVLEPQVLDLNHVVINLEKMLRRLIGEDIDLQQVLAPNLGPVRADPGQIEQVIMNLVVNARDAMPNGGRLTIDTANVDLDEEYVAQHVVVVPGPYILLAISDTGCGMDAATRERLFEPFFTTKAKGKGTGLGLSTVYGIVKQSGGNIWIYSEPGHGTTVKVYLPRFVEEAGSSATSRAPERPAVGTETILVAEDGEAVRNVVVRMLLAAGYRVLTAANGGEALLTCEQHRGEIDLLVTDVVMPQMSGRQLAERLQKVRPSMRVLYMSGYTDNAIVHHGVLDPGMRFISKPFSEADLARKVRDALDSDLPGNAEP